MRSKQFVLMVVVLGKNSADSSVHSISKDGEFVYVES